MKTKVFMLAILMMMGAGSQETSNPDSWVLC